MSQAFDAIVLGAGGVGSAAAYYLAKAGQRVLLLEQFELDHQKGSSYGYSRVIRYSYDHPIYINLMQAAYPLWFELEAEAGEKLYTQTGGLDIGFPDQPSWQVLKSCMDQVGITYELLHRDEVSDRFPQFRLDEGMAALYQADTGMLAASRCVLAHTRLAQAQGTVLLDRTPVTQIIPKATSVEVRTPIATYHAAHLIIAAGSWAKACLSQVGIDLPLQIMPCQLAFFQPDQPEAYEVGRFPVFLVQCSGEYGEMPYGLPSHNGVGVKLSTFYGWNTVNRPDEVDYTPSQTWVEQLRHFIRQYLPAVNGALLETRRCLYTLTPDKHFVIDRHPEYPHIAVGVGFSGHGFKFATLVGKMLTELALNGVTQYDNSLFQLSRFTQLRNDQHTDQN